MKERIAHIIKRASKSELPRRVIFFDTETSSKYNLNNDETELKLKLGVACYKRYDKTLEKINRKESYFDFKTAKEFWNYVFVRTKKKEKIYLVAHNIAFDFRVVKGFSTMKKEGFKVRKMIYSGTMNIWEFRKDDRTICVLDNMNYFKSSLKVLGKSIGIDKMEMPTDDDILLAKYCRRDVEIMVEAWRLFMDFLKVNNLGNFAKTVAGQAFNAYRHRFMPHDIFVHTIKAAVDMERSSYHGGRTEAFSIGHLPKRDYYLLDVNSMYPSLMRDQSYPRKIVGRIGETNIEEIERLLNNYAITARCLILADEPVFPVVHEDRLVFPIGEFETVLTTREILYAMQHNMLIGIKEGYLYIQDNIFKDYVEFFYQKRQEYKKVKNSAFDFICKLFLNSLYGKFGQRNLQYEKVGEDMSRKNGMFEYIDFETNQKVQLRTINGVVEQSIGQREGFNSMVAIPAHITADARLKLWSYFKLAGRENVYYCDTDSMIVNYTGYQNCLAYIKPELGYLSLKDSSKHLIIYGAKDYEFGKEVVIKGVRKDAKKLAENKYRQVRFEGLAGALRNNRIDSVFLSEQDKKLTRIYKKGRVGLKGRVEPFNIEAE